MRQHVESLSVSNNTTRRFDCLCGGLNTLSVTNNNGKIMWYCFRASCGSKGNLNKELSLTDLKGHFKSNEKEIQMKKLEDFISQWERYPFENELIIDYIKDNNCQAFINENKNNIFYDKIKDRVVFVEYEYGTVIKVALGRSLSGKTPKWYKYVSFKGGYFSAENLCEHPVTSVVIVEDAPSACSVARISDSIALCGTKWDLYYLKKEIEKFKPKTVFIALDYDARDLGLKLQRDLEGMLPVDMAIKMVQLDDDLKYINDVQKLETIFKGD